MLPSRRALLISSDHKRLDASLMNQARRMVVPLDEVRVDAWEYKNFQRQARELKKLRAMNTCAMDITFLRSMRDGHIFSNTLVQQALSDPASLQIRNVLEDTAATIPIHYNGSVQLLEKLSTVPSATAL